MTLAAADVVYAPDNSLGTDGATLVSNSAPQVNALQAIRSIVAYLVNLNLPAAQTADDIAIAIAADASALETLKEALETTADEFHSLSNMGIHSMFQDIDDWVTAAAGSPSSNLTTISSGQLGTDAVFGPEFQADSSIAAVTVYQRHAFRPRSGRVYRVTVTGSAEAANACTLTPIVAQLDDSYVVTAANKAASEALGFSAANTLQSVTFTMSVDVAGVDIDLDAVPYVRVGATIGPDSATSTNLRLVQILVEDVTEVATQIAAAISASEIAAAFAADSSALESLKDIIVADLDSDDAAAIEAALVAISAFGDVSGPASSADGNLPSFNGAGGKTLQDSGVASGLIVTGPASATDSNLAAFDGTTGKLLKDGGIATSAVMTLRGQTSGRALYVPADFSNAALWVPETSSGVTVRARSFDSNTQQFDSDYVVEFAGSGSDSQQNIMLASGYNVPCVPGQSYKAICDLLDTGTPVDTCNFVIDWMDNSNVFISSSAAVNSSSGGKVATAAFGTAPATARYIRFRINRNGTNTTGTWYAGAPRPERVNPPASGEMAAGTSTTPRDLSAADVAAAVAVVKATATALPVGAAAFLEYNDTTPVTNGSTSSGSALTLPVANIAGTAFINGVGGSQSGTWKNVSGVTQDGDGTNRFGYWVRTV